MEEDPIVAEVRDVREKLAAKFNYDVKAIFADLREQQAHYECDRVVSRPGSRQPNAPNGMKRGR